MTTSQSTSQDGLQQQQTAKVYNRAQGKNELVITIANGSGATINNIPILPFASTTEALPANITMTVKGFTNRAEMVAYFTRVGTSFAGAKIDTDNVDNYISAALVQQEQYPDGSKSQEVEMDLSQFRVATGGTGGFATTMTLTEDDFSCVVWPGLRLSLNQLLANSSMTFRLQTVGVTKTQEVSGIRAKVL